jgi:hypothetical protein
MSSDESDRSKSSSESEEKANLDSSSSDSEKPDTSKSNSDSESSENSNKSDKSDKSKKSNRSKSDNEAKSVKEEKSDHEIKEANPNEADKLVQSTEVKIDVLAHQGDDKDKFETTDRSFTFDKSFKYRSTKPLKIIHEINNELDNLLSELSKSIKSFKSIKESSTPTRDFETPKSTSLRKPVLNTFSFAKKFEEPVSENDYLITREQFRQDSPDKYIRMSVTELPDINTKLYPPSYYYSQRVKNNDKLEQRDAAEIILPDANKYHSFRSKITIDPNIYKPRSINQAIDILLAKKNI